MNKLKEHIVFKTLTLLLVATLLVPSAVKFVHTFTHHKHEVCLAGKTTHLHKLDVDCDFYKFKLNKSFTLYNHFVKLFSTQEKPLEIVSQYRFLSKYQHLHYSLRGPPSLV